jgi:hypothetical protein
MPSFSVDMNHVVSFNDEDMLVTSKCRLDIKDAPLRELTVNFPSSFAVNRIEGRNVMSDDYTVIEKNGKKLLKIPVTQGSMGKVDVTMKFERNV